MTFLEAAKSVLAHAEQPLHYREITTRALAEGLVETEGTTPWETLNSRVSVDIQKHGEGSLFIRVRPGVFALRSWGIVPEPSAQATHMAHVPMWSAVRGYLRVVHGRPVATVDALRAGIDALKGEDRDFSQPESWLKALDGPSAALGMALWKESDGTLNPRYVVDSASAARRHGLVGQVGEELRRTERGEQFLVEVHGEVVRELDGAEGIAQVLALVAEYGPARTAELFEPYREWCARETGLRSETSVRASLMHRLWNLLDRKLIDRTGLTYGITAAGLAWLGQEAKAVTGDDPPAAKDELVDLLREINEQQERVRARIREALYDMDPYAFEHLIKRLLDEMGYESVQVTKASGDKGVDVVGRIEVGITPVTEVIQAKRQRSNVGRPVLDALRGSLYRWSAQRGTIITTASFTQGARDAAFDVGAAPLQLIDGDRLVALLVDYGIGVKAQPVKLWRFDSEPFARAAGSAGTALDEDDEADSS
jgi:restriction system protein